MAVMAQFEVFIQVISKIGALQPGQGSWADGRQRSLTPRNYSAGPWSRQF
jgi:hypothetical protein